MKLIQKFGLSFAVVAVMAFTSGANAQPYPWEDQNPPLDQPLLPYVFLPEHYYLTLPPVLGAWQESSNGTVCQRDRSVTGWGCWFDDDTTNPDYNGPNEVCWYPDHAVADSQAGVYVPGLGCSLWKTTHYVWVTGDGTQTGTLIDE